MTLFDKDQRHSAHLSPGRPHRTILTAFPSEGATTDVMRTVLD